MAVNRRHDIELNGRGLMVKHGSYKKAAENIYASPKDMDTTPGETPLSSFWWQKRFSDFSGGGGQKYAESKNAQENRILDSQDMDFSTPGEAKLMKAMAASKALTDTNGYLLSAAGKLWLVDGTNIYHYNGSAWSSAVATGVTGDIVCIADDGNQLYGAGTSGGIYAGTTSSWTSWATSTGSQPTAMAFIKKQLRGVQGSKYYNLVTGAAQSDEIFDAGTGWTLNCITGHNQKIAFGGYKGSAGDERSYVWESDGTAGGTKLLVDDLPDGFKIHGLLSYLDVLYIWGGYELTAGSTAAGVLYAYTNGALTLGGHFKEAADIGSPLRTAVPTVDTIPRCALADGQFVYFGMNERSGLWRYDLKEGGLHRAFSAATSNNLVTGVATYKGKIYTAHSGAGAFVESGNQSSGWMLLPATTFDTSNQKLGRRIVLASAPPSPTVNYVADALPAAASPAWTKSSSGSPTEAVSGGILTTTGTGTSEQNYTITDSDLSDATGVTLEGRVKIVSVTNNWGQVLRIKDGTYSAALAIHDGFIRLSGTDNLTIYMTTTDAFHVYRLTVKDGVSKAYVDGVLVGSRSSLDVSTDKNIMFGEAGNVNDTHTEYWDYVRYWETGAFAPGETPLSSNPFTVEVSTDLGTNFNSLTGDSTYKKYDLIDIGLWDSLMVKVTCSNSSITLKDITIEAVPTLPNTNYWEMIVPLSDELAILGDNEPELINAQEVFEEFQTARDNKIPITFKEMDYDMQATQVTRKVLIEDLEQLSPYYDIEENRLVNCEIKLKLREF